MKNFLTFLLITFCCINLVSCSNDELTPPPVVIAPPVIPPPTAVFKPAVVNIANKSTTGRIAATKRLVKTITFNSTSAFDYKYKTKFTYVEYRALPNDNLYDPTEEALNVNTKKYDERVYTYNASNNLEKITINNIAYPEHNGMPAFVPILFSYLVTGVRVQVTRYQNSGAVLVYEYNNIGQVIKARDVDGILKYTFEYDASNNISSKYYFITDAIGNLRPQMHYTYIYYSNGTYTKNWLEVNADGTEKVNSTVTYTYNKNLTGVYNNEPVYKVLMDNEEGLAYLHIISNTNGASPKYFYDADGYLIKYDKHGYNDANDIILFIYQ